MSKMKKPKNKVFCYGCNKEKILFATQEKADNFIRFNSGEFLEKGKKAAMSSYYCRFCLGYHVTSNTNKASRKYFANRDRKEISKMRKAVNEQNAYLQNKDENIDYHQLLDKIVQSKIHLFETYLILGLFDQAQAVYQECLEEIKPHNWPYELKNKLRKKHESIAYKGNLLQLSMRLCGSTDEELELRLADMDTKSQELMRKIIHNHNLVLILAKDLDCIQEALLKNETVGIQEKLDECGSIINEVLQTKGLKKPLAEYRQRFAALKERFTRINSVHFESLKLEKYSHISEKKYRQNLLAFIDRIETLTEAYEEGKYMWCRNYINSSLVMLDEFEVKDENTELIRKQLELWEERVDKKIEP